MKANENMLSPARFEESSMAKSFHRISLGKKIVGWAVAFLLLSAVNSIAHQKTWPARQLKETYPQATRFSSQQVTLNNTQIERVERALNSRLTPDDRRPTFYPAYQGDQKFGMVIFVDETGENGTIDIGVALDSKGQIAAVKILAHREKSIITKEDFLKRFIGKSARDVLKLEDEIAPLKYAPLASKAVIRAVKKALLLKQEVFGN